MGLDFRIRRLERVKWKRRGEDLGLGYNGGDRG